MIEIIENTNKVIQQFLPGYIVIRMYYLLERPKFKLDHREIVDSIFISLIINSFVSIIPFSKYEHKLFYAMLIGVALPVLFHFKTKPIIWIQNKFGIRFKKDFAYDPLKKYSEEKGCYVRVDLHDENITVQGILDHYDYEDDEKVNKYIALSEYEIYNYDGELIEKYIRDTDVIMIDQNKLKYFKIYR